MKTKYTSPTMSLVKLHQQTALLSGSNIGINSSGDPVDAGGAAAPEFNIFDD